MFCLHGLVFFVIFKLCVAASCVNITDLDEQNSLSVLNTTCQTDAICEIVNNKCHVTSLSISIMVVNSALSIFTFPHLTQSGTVYFDNNVNLRIICLPMLQTFTNIFSYVSIVASSNPSLEVVYLNYPSVNFGLVLCGFPNDVSCLICQDRRATTPSCSINTNSSCLFATATSSIARTQIPSMNPTRIVTTMVNSVNPTQYPTDSPSMMPTQIVTKSPTTPPDTIVFSIETVITGNLFVSNTTLVIYNSTTSTQITGTITIASEATLEIPLQTKPVAGMTIVVPILEASLIVGAFGSINSTFSDLIDCERVVSVPMQTQTSLSVSISVDATRCPDEEQTPTWEFALAGLAGAFAIASIFGGILLWRRRQFIEKVKRDFQETREQNLEIEFERMRNSQTK